MENPKFLGVPCPIHPTEFIQRVNTDINASQQLYCMECILQQDDPHFDTSSLKSINDLIATAANFYQHNKDKAKIAEDVPSDFAESLSRQAENLDKLSKHIEEEKKRATYIFDMISKDFLRVIEDKKNEYLYSLDQQLFNLRYWYIFFDKQIKKAYPMPDDIPFLFPSQEDLTKKLQKISNSTQLMAFVRNIKEDLNEQKLGLRVDQKAYLNTLKTELTKIENTKPILSVEDSCMSEIKTSLKKTLEETLDRLLVLENPIKDVVKGKDFDSKLLKPEHFELLRTWIPKDYKFNLKLLYRASRDGMNGTAFHSKCDGKGATLTVIKCEFNGSNKVSLIGGFLDQNWSQTGQYINSPKAFLYSVTKKVKCPVKTAQHAGYGNYNYGPTFGAGHDLCVWAGGSQNYVNPNAYNDTMKLVETPNYVGGQGHFKPLDIEVYLVS